MFGKLCFVREYFGCGPLIAADLWVLIRNQGVLPVNASINKLLWTLHFMKSYSMEEILCNTVKVDNKIFRETCWSFIESIALLEHEVVSTNRFEFLHNFNLNVLSIKKKYVP